MLPKRASSSMLLRIPRFPLPTARSPLLFSTFSTSTSSLSPTIRHFEQNEEARSERQQSVSGPEENKFFVYGNKPHRPETFQRFTLLDTYCKLGRLGPPVESPPYSSNVSGVVGKAVNQPISRQPVGEISDGTGELMDGYGGGGTVDLSLDVEFGFGGGLSAPNGTFVGGYNAGGTTGALIVFADVHGWVGSGWEGVERRGGSEGYWKPTRETLVGEGRAGRKDRDGEGERLQRHVVTMTRMTPRTGLAFYPQPPRTPISQAIGAPSNGPHQRRFASTISQTLSHPPILH
ncbi:hypothetical protein BJ508DRAFT_332714 [Ascobolus immersus RN42]|uniref:Uncharacterized protein n=1 Tax=Ascobolus immersus RN42 TaxID=1160509 RepID=A0A3N4HQJ5_ASCIM|nr:hypothetical protein BJ508DRAFT_332714 [Ascobolus immersus RN42]